MTIFGLIWAQVEYGIYDWFVAATGVAGAGFADLVLLVDDAGGYYGTGYAGWNELFQLIPVVVMVALSAVLTSRTTGGSGGRLLVGFLVGPALAALTVVMTLISWLKNWGDYGDSEFIWGEIWRAGVGGLVLGSVAGLVGAVLSIGVRRP
jgi:hypothetical protein